MLIFSIGMPRAGSGWYYNLMHDLVTAAGGQDARQVRRRYRLQSILTEVNCNIGAFTPRRLLLTLLPSLLGNTYVVKAHAAPTPAALALIRRGLARAAYIYRDPRDAMLSAFENGQRALEKGRPNAFSHLSDFEKSLAFILEYCRVWEGWMACAQALHTRYEALRDDYDPEAGRLAAFLGMDAGDPRLQPVIAHYRPEEARRERKGLHFRQGKTGRYREKLTQQQIETMNGQLRSYIERMGYPLD
jgi:hypothetical protein